MRPAIANLDNRRRAYNALSSLLGALNDDQVVTLLAQSGSWQANHGNRSGVIDINGANVFVKKVALTGLELAPGNRTSTANIFNLPLFYHYGVGSAGFGAWRELRACLRTSEWVLSGECPHFPLAYHQRLLPRIAPSQSPERLTRLRQAVDYWERSDAVRARLEAISAAPASIVLFLEYVPQTLRTWLNEELKGRSMDAALEAAILRFYDQWRDTAVFMNERGMLHFDLNGSNLLTDGEQVYVADFGLALCSDFDLSPDERAFFEMHSLYDQRYVDWAFVEWLTREPEPRPDLTPALNALVGNCATVAGRFGAFINALSNGSKRTPYPSTELATVLARHPASG